jgi:hypothetical protein
MNTVRLCHLCEMGQRGTDSDWFLHPGMTRFETQRSSGTLLVRFASKIIFIAGVQTVTKKIAKRAPPSGCQCLIPDYTPISSSDV